MSTPLKGGDGIHFGMNRRDLDRVFLALGGEIKTLRRTGEVMYAHPLLRHRVKANCRRKDAAGQLVRYVLEVKRTLEARRCSTS